jgi:hypothetical protein
MSELQTYTIDGPDGKTHTIDGPPGATREQVISKVKERLAAQNRVGLGKTSGYEDVLKSVPAGVAEGGVGAAEFLGRGIKSIPAVGGILKGGEMLARGLGYDIPSGADVIEFVKPYVGDTTAQQGSLYDPKTHVGRYAKSGAEGAVYAPIMGAASVPGAIAAGVGMGLASEAGGDIAGSVFGEEYRPYGELTGAVLSGVRRGVKKPPVKGVVEAPAHAARARVQYKLMEMTPLPHANANIIRNNARLTARIEGYTPKLHKGMRDFFSYLDEFAPTTKAEPMGAVTGIAPSTSQKAMTFGDLDKIRRALGPAKKLGGDDARIASMIEDKIDDLVAGMKGGKMFKDARKTYFLRKKAEFLDDLQEQVFANSGTYRLAGVENAVRTKFRQLYNQLHKKTAAARQLKGTFNKDEQALIKKMSNPKISVRNIARIIASRVNNPITQGTGLMGGLLLTWYTGDWKYAQRAAGLSVIGAAASGLANRSAQRHLNDFVKLSKGGVRPPRGVIRAGQPAVRGAIEASKQFQEQE